MAVRTPAGVRVLLHNRQNSTSIAYDPATDTAAYQRYTPYGARRGTTPLAATERRFLDKTEDDTGLIAMGARYYDPAIGRFISVDPLADLMRPQTLAAYSYSLGNPTTLADPSGLAAIDPDGVAGGGAPCDEECLRRDIQERYDQYVRNINAGVPTDDNLVVGVPWTEQQREQLVAGFLASPCGGDDRSGCGGNTRMLFYCQLQGTFGCLEQADRAAAAGDAAAGVYFSAATTGVSKVVQAVGARVGRSSGGSGFRAPRISIDRHGRRTNGRYTVSPEGMAPHTNGSPGPSGKSQFLMKVDADSVVLDAAAFADEMNLWVGNSAKVHVTNGPVGVVGRTGELTDWVTVTRNMAGTIHGWPSGPPR